MQNEKGQVIGEYWADNIPITSEALYKAMRGDLQNKAACLFGKRRRKSCPAPTPPATPPPVAPPPATPPVGPPVLPPDPVEPEKEPGFPWILAVLSTLIGAGIGVAQGWKKEHEDSVAPSVTKL